MKKKYIEFFYPGSFVSESSVCQYKKGAKIPDGAYAYRTFTRIESVIDGKKVKSEPTYNEGTFYAPEAKVTLAADVEREYPGDENRILRSNVLGNKLPAVIKTRGGIHLGFNSKIDKVLQRAVVE